MRVRRLLILLPLLFLAGCFFPIDDGDPAQTFHIVYEETFEDPSSYVGTYPWEVWLDAKSTGWIADEALQIRVDAEDWITYSLVGGIHLGSIFRVDAVACRIAGPIDNEFGIIFHWVDDDNFMRFSISSDGYMRVRKYLNAQLVEIEDWTECGEISLQEACYQITVVGSGSEYDFYVDEVWVLSVTDTSFQGGRTGVGAGTLNESGVHIGFPAFYVWEPN